MKAISKLLLAGMLAMGTAMPAVYAHIPVHAHAQVTITDALAYCILSGVVGQLEAQLNQSLSKDFLYSEYKNGRVLITYLGQNADGYHLFSVEYMDGIGTILLEVLP